MKELNTDLITNQYGFVWGDVMVERTASNKANPKFQVLRVYALTGEVVEILMRPRSTKVKIFPKENDNGQRPRTISTETTQKNGLPI